MDGCGQKAVEEGLRKGSGRQGGQVALQYTLPPREGLQSQSTLIIASMTSLLLPEPARGRPWAGRGREGGLMWGSSEEWIQEARKGRGRRGARRG